MQHGTEGVGVHARAECLACSHDLVLTLTEAVERAAMVAAAAAIAAAIAAARNTVSQQG
jgi:hypothetical protein